MSSIPQMKEAKVPQQKSMHANATAITLDDRRVCHAFQSPLRYHKRSALLLLIYLPLLVVPWVMTCILTIRPLNKSAYINQQGDYGDEFPREISFWLQTVRVLNTVAAVLAVPLTSALLAHGAVVYAQRSSAKKLNLRQTIVLADRSWTDIIALCDAFRHGIGSNYLWFAAVLLLIVTIQAPLQQLLVSTRNDIVMTWKDCPERFFSGPHEPASPPVYIGSDAEPFVLSSTPADVVVQAVVAQLAGLNEDTQNDRLWYESRWVGDNDNNTLVASDPALSYVWNYASPEIPRDMGRKTFFVTSIPSVTTTGMLREHIMRVNSSISCSPAPFPVDCTGFSRRYVWRDSSLAICSSSDPAKSPWAVNRARQDIREQIYLGYELSNDLANLFDISAERPTNFSVRCTAESTRGYFELGNHHTNYMWQPLIREWPDEATIQSDFNDRLWIGDDFFPVRDIQDYNDTIVLNWPPHATEDIMPGPLTAAALALFGNASFLNSLGDVSNASDIKIICNAGIPFRQLRYFGNNAFKKLNDVCLAPQNITVVDTAIQYMTAAWLMPFAATNTTWEATQRAETLWIAAVISATDSWLTLSSGLTSEWSYRPIYTSAGSAITRPDVSTSGIIVLSVLIGVQTLGLILLVCYIYKLPTWTAHFDAIGVISLFNSSMSIPATNAEVKGLLQQDGVVGIRTRRTDNRPNPIDNELNSFELVRGGEGNIQRRHAARVRWNMQWLKIWAAKKST